MFTGRQSLNTTRFAALLITTQLLSSHGMICGPIPSMIASISGTTITMKTKCTSSSWYYDAPMALSGSSDDNLPSQDDLDEADDEDQQVGSFASEDASSSLSLYGRDDSRMELPNHNFEIFLNQCAIQSFLFLIKSMRDTQTVVWLENFTQPSIYTKKKATYVLPTGGSADSKLLGYHGLGAINTTLFPTWDSYFAQMLQQPRKTFLVESNQKYIPVYEHEINPPSLCSRIISIREQIAVEFVQDLDAIINMGSQILENYGKAIQDVLNEQDETKVKIERCSFLFLDFDASEENDFAPSPLRKGNFDLLVTLVTQESIHRIIYDPERTSRVEISSNYFLLNFYLQRLRSHFMGSQPYRRADDFLENLLFAPASNLQISEETTSLVDPVGLVELIVKEREKVALEWKVIAANVPDAHMEIKRLQLQLLMRTGETISAEESSDSFQ